MAVLFENVSVLVLGTDDEDGALEALTDTFPRYMIVRVDIGESQPDEPETVEDFHRRHDYGYMGPHARADVQSSIDEGRGNFEMLRKALEAAARASIR